MMQDVRREIHDSDDLFKKGKQTNGVIILHI